MISHIISLACNDDAYLAPTMTPGKVLTLGVRKGLNCQPIPWKEEMQDVPVFRVPVQTPKGSGTSPDTALPYEKYHEWVKRLGEETGFVQVFTTYCLRRATGNAINGKFLSPLIQVSKNNIAIYQMIPIPTRPSATWSWIKPTRPFSIATIFPA
jgi:Protein of unknown function (DUF3435)